LKFTEGFWHRLEVPKGVRDVIVFDDELAGFGCRKFASGRAFFIVKYAVNGQTRRQSLCECVRGGLKKARQLAAEVRARASLGQDIIAEKQAAAAKNANILGPVVPLYLKTREDHLRPKSHHEVARYLRTTWKPLHRLPLASITRQHIVDIIDAIPHKVAADRARMALSGLYSWAIEKGRADINPTMHVALRGKNGGRTRTLSEAELVQVWRCCGDDDYGRIVRLLLLTGQRREEIAALRWLEIDFDKCQIDLPEHRTKNGCPHIIPLSAEAIALLPAQEEGREFVFGRGTTGFARSFETLGCIHFRAN
jgi:integrase